MKKILLLVVITILFSVSILETLVYAEETPQNIEVIFTGTKEIKQDTKSIQLNLQLGEVSGYSESVILGFEAILNYDKDLFKSASLEGENGWTVRYEESTNRVIGEMNSQAIITSNTVIAKITLIVNDNLVANQTGKVELSGINLTDGTNDFTFNKEITISVEEASLKETIENLQTEQPATQSSLEKKNTEEETIDDVIITSSMETAKTSEKPSTLPKAGMENILIIAVIITSIAMIIFRFKSKRIKY